MPILVQEAEPRCATVVVTGPPHAPGGRPPHDFDQIYATATPPWDIGRPQPAFDRLARRGGLVGRVLDVGCGTGEHALLAAALGHDAVGLDISPNAVELAQKKAADRDLAVRFLVFDDEERERYVGGLSAVVPTGGHYHLLCFSDRQPGDWGPRRVTAREIRASLAEGWVVDCIEPTVMDITIDTAGAQAWEVTATRARLP